MSMTDVRSADLGNPDTTRSNGDSLSVVGDGDSLSVPDISGTLSDAERAIAERIAYDRLRLHRGDRVSRPRLRGCDHAGWRFCVPRCFSARGDLGSANAAALGLVAFGLSVAAVGVAVVGSLVQDLPL